MKQNSTIHAAIVTGPDGFIQKWRKNLFIIH